MSRNITISVSRPRPHVGFGSILFHTIMTCVTGGFWLVVLLVRYLLK